MNKLLLACSLGDGHISKNGTFEILHQAKQEEYLRYKAQLFNCEDRVYKKNNNGYDAYSFKKGVYNNHDNGKEIRKLLYGVMNHKYYSKTIVNNLDKFCIAILYCDDGSLIPKKRNGIIHAYNCTISLYCSYEECDRLVNKIKELFDVQFKICKDKNKYLIRCGTKEARKFIPQIRELVPTFKCFENNKLKKDF